LTIHLLGTLPSDPKKHPNNDDFPLSSEKARKHLHAPESEKLAKAKVVCEEMGGVHPVAFSPCESKAPMQVGLSMKSLKGQLWIWRVGQQQLKSSSCANHCLSH
jgi:hypothetical protein